MLRDNYQEGSQAESQGKNFEAIEESSHAEQIGDSDDKILMAYFFQDSATPQCRTSASKTRALHRCLGDWYTA